MLRKIKHIFFLLFFGLLFWNPVNTFSQTVTKKTRILFLLDASSSMTFNWNENTTRFGVASNILLRIVDSIYSINNEVEFAVRAYGTQYPAQEKNCTDTKLEVPFNYQNVDQIKTRLQYIKPIGFSPIAYSLIQSSENELNNVNDYDYSIIFITDGGESCNGDICIAFKHFLEKKISIKPYIIGLDKNTNIKTYYDCLGNFIEVNTASDINEAVKMIVDANKKIIEKPKKLKLETTFSNIPIIKDTIKKIVVNDTTKSIQKIEKNSIEIPKLVYNFFPYEANKKIIFYGKNYLVSIKKAVLTFQIEDEIKKPVPIEVPKIVKDNMGLSFLKMNEKKIEKTKLNLVAKKQNLPKNSKAVLHFNWDTPLIKETNSIARLTMNNKLLLNNKVIIVAKNNTLKKQKTTLHFEYDEPVVRESNSIAVLKTNNVFLLKNKKANLKASPLAIKKQKATLHFEIEEPKIEVITFIKTSNYPKRYSYAYKIPNQFLVLNKKPATLHFTVDVPKPIVKKDTVAKAKLNTGEMIVKTETKTSDETKIQIFLIGPNGKIYSKASPMIEILDAKTKQPVMKFQRKVENGEPTIQNIPAGNYDIIIREFNVARAINFEIHDKMLNKVMLELEEGTLHFVYGNNLKRPVEYNAVVNRRFAAGATILQKCIQVLHYDPGTYYVEINTLPIIKRSVELEFFKEYLLPIDEPGILQITNTNKMGKIDLQCVLGDQFVTFYQMEIYGDISKQKINIQPGIYKAIFPKDPAMPQAGSKVIDFKINSNETKTIELN